MKQNPNCKLIGAQTYGSSGNPKPIDLGNGVTVILPSWRDLFPDGSILEGKNGENKVVDVFPLELPGKWSRLGELAYTVAKSEGGWLTLGWNQSVVKQASLPAAKTVK